MAYQNDYDKLLRDIRGSGQNWSEYDLQLAQDNPDAGRSIFSAKQDFAKAQNDEDRLAANLSAERIRQTYGGYLGGKDGSGFTLAASSYRPADASSQSSLSTARQPVERAPQAAPYSSPYSGQISALIDALSEREPFSYSPAADPNYQSYAEQARRLGGQARQNALGSAAALTGGQLSSYALAAAQQAQNQYNAALSDRIPELQALAYEMYLGDLNQQRADLSALTALDEQAYNRYLDRRRDELDTWQRNYNLSRDLLADQRQEQERADSLARQEDGDWRQRYQDALSSLRYQDQTAYSRAQDQRAQDAERAAGLAAAGDYSGYGGLWDLSGAQLDALSAAYQADKARQNQQLARDAADWAAQYGDTSQARALGVDTSYRDRIQQADLASRLAGGSGTAKSSSRSKRSGASQSSQSSQSSRAAQPSRAAQNADNTPRTAGSQISTYREAADYLKSLGKDPSGLMTQAEWARHRSNASDTSGASSYASYPDYLHSFLSFASKR